MDLSKFGPGAAGKLVPTIRSLKAFVPNPLPPHIDLGASVGLIAEASQHLGELNGIGRTIPNPLMLVRPLQQQEALSSSAMEGTYTTLTELVLLEAESVSTKTPTSDTREVHNYTRALRHSLEMLEKLPLCLRIIREAHALLLDGVSGHRGAYVVPGEFKRDQNFIGKPPIENARYVPPPPAETLVCLDALEKYIQRDNPDSLPQIVDAAIVHYHFEAIHPFPDGNGRVGRILIALMLHERRALAQPLLYLSPFFEEHKDAYIDLMFDVSCSGNWRAWIEFFCSAVIQSSKKTITTIKQLQDLQSAYRRKIQASNNSARLIAVVDGFFERPVTTAKLLETQFGITAQTAHNYIAQLIKAEILSELPETSRPKIYQAHDILAVLRH